MATMKSFIALSLAIGFWNGSGNQEAKEPDAKETKVVGELIEAMIGDAFEDEGRKDLFLVVIRDTRHDRVEIPKDKDPHEWLQEELFAVRTEDTEPQKLSKAMTGSFVRNNRRSWRLPGKLEIPINHEFVSDHFVQEIFKNDDGWKQFHRRFPGNSLLINVSRPGLDESGNQALFYYSWMGDDLYGGGYLVFAQKVKGKWKVVVEMLLWVS